MTPRSWLWTEPTVRISPYVTFNRSAAGSFSQPDAQCLWGIQAASSIKFNFSRKDLSSVTKKILQYLHLILFTRLPYIALDLWLGVGNDCMQFSEDAKWLTTAYNTLRKCEGDSPPSHYQDKQQYSFPNRKEIPLLSNPLTSKRPTPVRILIPPFPLDPHFYSSKHLPLPPSHQTRGAFSAEMWQMAPSELRCPWIISSWLPWLVKAGNSNARARGLPASLYYFFFFCSSSKGISKEWPLIADFLIHPDWLLGALKKWYQSHGDRSRQNHMSPVTDSLWLFQKCQCSQHLQSTKGNTEAPDI